jgi:hypothetical protein
MGVGRRRCLLPRCMRQAMFLKKAHINVHDKYVDTRALLARLLLRLASYVHASTLFTLSPRLDRSPSFAHFWAQSGGF